MGSQRERVGDYILGRVIGSGSSSKVRYAEHAVTGAPVAIKIIKKDRFEQDPVLRQKLEREIGIVRLMKHPNLIKFLDVCESRTRFYLILEHAANGPLVGLFSEPTTPTHEAVFAIFRQIIYGIEHLHHHGICHRDLKAENILLDSFNNVRIADFGFARWMRSNIADSSCGSPHYAAPEVIRGLHYNGCFADVWSAGVILFALLARRLPFDDRSIRGVMTKVKNGAFEMPTSLPPDTQDLIRKMLCVDPRKRITIAGIKEHPAFREGYPIGYVLPAPIPLVFSDDPIEPDEKIVQYLEHIGFDSMEEIRAELASEGRSMAKVFYSLHALAQRPESLPWASGQLKVPTSPPDLFRMTPDEHEFGSAPVDFGPRSPDGSGSSTGSMPECDAWTSFPATMPMNEETWFKLKCDQMPVLMFHLQEMLTSLGYEFFHPNPFELYGRRAAEAAYAVITAIQQDGWVDLRVGQDGATAITRELATAVLDVVAQWSGDWAPPWE
jgi:BR serine/threonine kinase